MDIKQTKASLTKIKTALAASTKKIEQLHAGHKQVAQIASKDGANLKKRLADGKHGKDPETAKLTKSLQDTVDGLKDSGAQAEHKKMLALETELKKLERDAAGHGKEDAEAKKIMEEIRKSMAESKEATGLLSELLKQQADLQKAIIQNMKS